MLKAQKQVCLIPFLAAVLVSACSDDDTMAITKDAGTMMDTPSDCADHQLSSPNGDCLPACESGYQWIDGACVDFTQTPDAGAPADTGPRDTGIPPVPTDAGVPATDPIDIDQRTSELAQAQCDRNERCQPFFGDFGGDTETCVADTEAELKGIWSSFPQMVAAGRLGFDSSKFDECINALRNAACATGVEATACLDYLKGANVGGMPCLYTFECDKGFFCENGPQGCGVCTPQGAMPGAPCNRQDGCVDGLGCLNAGNQTICAPINAQLGQPCGTVDTGLCNGQMNCTGDSMNGFFCTAPAGEGSTCDTPENAAPVNPACDIYNGFNCFEGVCSAWTLGGDGEACTDPVLCSSDFYCGEDEAGEPTNCTAYPATGEACWGDQAQGQGFCNDDNFCDGSFSCAAFAEVGQTCDQNIACRDPLFCTGTCVTDLPYIKCE